MSPGQAVRTTGRGIFLDCIPVVKYPVFYIALVACLIAGVCTESNPNPFCPYCRYNGRRSDR